MKTKSPAAGCRAARRRFQIYDYNTTSQVFPQDPACPPSVAHGVRNTRFSEVREALERLFQEVAERCSP